MTVVPATARAGEPAVDATVSDEGRRALDQAQASGQRVEVTGERSERTTVFANPDGFTFTLEESSVPVRVAKPDGGWQAPDATLERKADGSIAPKAASAEMTFSGGGNAEPLVELSRKGRSMELDWRGTLPAPQLDGPSALYPEVLPGVDLKVTATVESFRQVLVVKTAEAAANPALKELTFGLKTDGVTLRKGAAGNLAAIDGDGNTVFQAPPAQMWDSAGKAAESQPAPQLHTRTLFSDGEAGQEEPSSGAVSGTAESGSGTEPRQGDNVVRMDVNVTDTALSVIPDTQMLTGTEPEHFPVFIDPTVSWGESTRTMLRSDGYASYGWDNGSDNLGEGVGKCGSWGGEYCGPGYVKRLYFQFAPDGLTGKRVLDATFRVTEPWAFQCSPRVVQLVRTNNISTSTTWATRPAELDWLTEKNVSAGRGSACDPYSATAPIEFHDDSSQSWQNLTSTVRDFAAGEFSRLTFEIRAKDENDASAWKRFRNDATLAVTYVAYPALAQGVGIVTGSGAVCSKDPNAPTTIASPNPALNATPRAAWGAGSGAKLRAWFRVETKAADGTWSGSGTARPSSPNFGVDNVKVTYTWENKLTDGALHRYAALTQVFYDNGSYSQSSPYGSWCYFKVDSQAPKKPTITFDGPYKECVTNDCPAAGAPGVSGGVTFRPASGDVNKRYEYYLAPSTSNSTPSTWNKLADGVVTAKIIPPKDGQYTLYVRAYDSLQRAGDIAAADFKVAMGTSQVGNWNFAEDSGQAMDSGTGKSDATLFGAASRDDRGRRGLVTHDANGVKTEQPVEDKGLVLDGTSGYAATAGPVVQTAASYTVAAWVRLEDGTRNYTALSQDPSLTPDWYSAFYLGYRSESKTWELRTSPKNTTDGDISTQIVKADQPATLNAWTHLAATYDASSRQISLYVNGKWQNSYTVSGAWSSTGRLQIGRAWWRGAYYDQWKGSLDEVAAWQRALTSDEIADIAALVMPGGWTAAEMVADWSATGSSGSIVKDGSPYHRDLTLENGAAVQQDEIVFDGDNDAATTTVRAPVVDDTGSFTVSAMVALQDDKVIGKDDGYIGQVVGQRTSDGSAWGLWFEKEGKATVLDQVRGEIEVPVGTWHFGRLGADGKAFSSVNSASDTINGAVRVTGVFDAQEQEITLRVAAGPVSQPQEFVAQVGSGEFALAKGFTAGGWKHYLPVNVAGVRMWAGAIRKEEQVREQVGY
ncbi:LamG domain-containing protein [Streptomyces sp. NPDC020422]|uniref:LamG domain-containing protein n=1 Tax=Streptomyces sp. NPDC020422 TaxID=3365074 RepID=UPI00379E5F58